MEEMEIPGNPQKRIKLIINFKNLNPFILDSNENAIGIIPSKNWLLFYKANYMIIL